MAGGRDCHAWVIFLTLLNLISSTERANKTLVCALNWSDPGWLRTPSLALLLPLDKSLDFSKFAFCKMKIILATMEGKGEN